ncbi:uncharacterized protein L201_000802 [Kwoniella dendrophila CBS 6074]|uniref:Myb-like domain-containing protein n=1 Tax=Kwoniella dendrophila CBS 6074 TaxID=1295534 RepID=A0AAX4JMA0_9TREE
MPKAFKATSLPTCKPYSSLESSDSKPKLEEEKPKKSKTKSTTNTSSNAKRPWTSEELMQVYEHVKKNGCKSWENAVEGRTSNQCYKVWTQTLDPYLKNAVINKGK